MFPSQPDRLFKLTLVTNNSFTQDPIEPHCVLLQQIELLCRVTRTLNRIHQMFHLFACEVFIPSEAYNYVCE